MAEETTNAPRAGLLAFFETVMSWVVIAVVVVGGSTLAVTWQSSSIEFVGDDRMQVSRQTWWGLVEGSTVYRADSRHGWMIIRSGGDEVPVTSKPILLRRLSVVEKDIIGGSM